MDLRVKLAQPALPVTLVLLVRRVTRDLPDLPAKPAPPDPLVTPGQLVPKVTPRLSLDLRDPRARLVQRGQPDLRVMPQQNLDPLVRKVTRDRQARRVTPVRPGHKAMSVTPDLLVRLVTLDPPALPVKRVQPVRRVTPVPQA